MSPWHLLWIIPLSGTVGFIASCFCQISSMVDRWEEHEKEMED